MYIRKSKSQHLESQVDYQQPQKASEIVKGLSDWVLPMMFTKPTASSVVRYWVKTCFDASGRLPEYSPFAQRNVAVKLLAQFEFEQIMKAVYFMSTPFSKYYQYPYTLDCVPKAIEEMKLVESSTETKVYSGFLGLRVKQLGPSKGDA